MTTAQTDRLALTWRCPGLARGLCAAKPRSSKWGEPHYTGVSTGLIFGNHSLKPLAPDRRRGEASHGRSVGRSAGISEATYYNWHKKYAGLMPSEMKRLRQLEEENSKLKTHRWIAGG
jgi:hypothetical protein